MALHLAEYPVIRREAKDNKPKVETKGPTVATTRHSPLPSPLKPGLQMGMFPLWREKAGVVEFTYLSWAKLHTEPGHPARSSTTWSFPCQVFSLRFFLLNSSRKSPSFWLWTALFFFKVFLFHFGKWLITEDHHTGPQKAQAKEQAPFWPGGASFFFTIQGRESVRTEVVGRERNKLVGERASKIVYCVKEWSGVMESTSLQGSDMKTAQDSPSMFLTGWHFNSNL